MSKCWNCGKELKEENIHRIGAIPLNDATGFVLPDANDYVEVCSKCHSELWYEADKSDFFASCLVGLIILGIPVGIIGLLVYFSYIIFF